MQTTKFYTNSIILLDNYLENYSKSKSKVAVSEAIRFCKDTLDDLKYQKLPLLTYCMKFNKIIKNQISIIEEPNKNQFTKCYVKTLENCMNLIKL